MDLNMQGDVGSRGRILLVEDEDLLRWSVRSFLGARGWVLDDAADGERAAQLIETESYDVVVTDLTIPGVDGLALAARVRERCPDTQVIVITGQTSKDTILRALRAGVFDYVEKPFDLEFLLIAVERAREKARMQRELVRLARTDGITGLSNVRHFYEILDREMQRARRQGNPLSLVLVDVDNFKGYNDRFGHLAGDEALVRVASCLTAVCRRDVDAAFRYGGDEFVLLLPETDLGVARQVAERVREAVHALGLDGISLSVGLAELDGETAREFIKRADEAMYLAKQLGGDRAVTVGVGR